MNPVLNLCKLNAGFYSFLGGMFLSASINLATTVFVADNVLARAKILIISAILTLISAFIWFVIYIKLDPIQKIALSDAPSGINPEDALRTILASRLLEFGIYFFLAIIISIAGLALLLVR